MKLQLRLQNTAKTEQILDASHVIRECTFSSNLHGVEAINVKIEQSVRKNLQLYTKEGLLDLEINQGPTTIANARVEDPGIAIGGDVNSVSLKSLGYWRAFSDIPYSAMWSMTDYGQFREITSAEVATRTPEKYQTDTNGRLYIAPRKGETYQINNCSLNYITPNNSGRLIVGLQFDYRFRFPTNWIGRVITHNLWMQNGEVLITLSGNGSTQTGSAWVTSTGRPSVYMDLYYNGTATYAGETGDAFFEITNLRLVSSLTKSIQTTLTASASAGSNVTLSVASSEGMYIGQQILIGSSATAMERVTITAINSNTSITIASLAANKSNGALVRAHKITPDQIVFDCANIVSSVNPNQLSNNLGLIQNINRDISDTLVFEDADMSEILADIAQKGDGSQPYEIGVNTNRQCYFRPQYSTAKTWYVYADDLTLERSFSALYNSAYGQYQGTKSETMRTAIATDTDSAARHGLIRRQAVKSDTMSSVVALAERDSSIANTKDTKPRAQFPIEKIFSQAGIPANVAEIRAGDLLILQNPPATGEIDAAAEMRISRTELDLITGVLTVEPELPLPTVDVQLAR